MIFNWCIHTFSRVYVVDSNPELVVSLRQYKSQSKVKIHADLLFFYLSKSGYKHTLKIFRIDYKNLFDLSLMRLNSFIFNYSPQYFIMFPFICPKVPQSFMLPCFYTQCFPLYILHCPPYLLHLANSSTSFYDPFRSPSLQRLPWHCSPPV